MSSFPLSSFIQLASRAGAREKKAHPTPQFCICIIIIIILLFLRRRSYALWVPMSHTHIENACISCQSHALPRPFPPFPLSYVCMYCTVTVCICTYIVHTFQKFKISKSRFSSVLFSSFLFAPLLFDLKIEHRLID